MFIRRGHWAGACEDGGGLAGELGAAALDGAELRATFQGGGGRGRGAVAGEGAIKAEAAVSG